MGVTEATPTQATLKCFEHQGTRWIEGHHEGQWFAVDEHGERLILARHAQMVGCYTGETIARVFHGERVGLLSSIPKAFRWLRDDPISEPRADKAGMAQSIKVPIV